MSQPEPRECVVCAEPRLDFHYPHDVSVCRECDLKRHRRDLAGLTAGEFIAGSGWVLARTMLNIPHQYTVRDLRSPDARRTTALGHAEFEWFVHRIYGQGTRERWGYYFFSYLRLDGWKYWTMGLAPEVTTIINRAAISPETEVIIEVQVTQARATVHSSAQSPPT